MAEKYESIIRLQEDNRDVPQFEMERNIFFQEREQSLPDEYPFQDFNYGPWDSQANMRGKESDVA